MRSAEPPTGMPMAVLRAIRKGAVHPSLQHARTQRTVPERSIVAQHPRHVGVVLVHDRHVRGHAAQDVGEAPLIPRASAIALHHDEPALIERGELDGRARSRDDPEHLVPRQRVERERPGESLALRSARPVAWPTARALDDRQAIRDELAQRREGRAVGDPDAPRELAQGQPPSGACVRATSSRSGVAVPSGPLRA